MSQFFAQPGIFAAWALQSGQYTPNQLARLVKDAGFKWLALECPPATDGEILALRSQCHVLGLYFGVWEVNPLSLDVLERTKPNFWIPNVESRAHDDIYPELLKEFRKKHPLLPAAVVTNGDFDTKPWIKANVKAIPEAYQNDNPMATPENMVFRMKQQGYTYVFPCLGVYGGYPLSNYTRFGDGYSVYLAEEMQPADWELAKEWND